MPRAFTSREMALLLYRCRRLKAAQQFGRAAPSTRGSSPAFPTGHAFCPINNGKTEIRPTILIFFPEVPLKPSAHPIAKSINIE